MKTTTPAPDPAATFSTRLVSLPGGAPGLRTPLHVTATEPADANGTPIVDFVASDETLDRYDEIITPAGWDLTAYRRNPVFQTSHQYGDIIFTLGKALIT